MGSAYCADFVLQLWHRARKREPKVDVPRFAGIPGGIFGLTQLDLAWMAGQRLTFDCGRSARFLTYRRETLREKRLRGARCVGLGRPL